MYRFCMDPETGYIRFTYGYNGSGKISKAYEYKNHTTYENRGNSVVSKYFIDPSTNYLEYSYDYNSNHEVIVKYTYLPKTTYRDGHKNRIESEIHYD